MITVTAMKWVPPFAAGLVRDFRVRWILNEVGWPYEVRLVDAPMLASAEYRASQPFGQVPCLEEDGRPPLFESGAIVLDIATRAARLIPPEGPDRAQVVAWVIAALNSIEPPIANVAEVDYFLEDEGEKAQRRPKVLAAAKKRLDQLQDALGGRDWLVGEAFTVADLVVASVLRIADRLELLADYPALTGYLARCLDRPAFAKAVADQCATFANHGPADMKWERR